MARSLMEGMDPAPAKAAAKKGDSGKLIFAVVLLAVAAVVVAWSQGWILAGKGPQISAEEQAKTQQEFSQQKKATDQAIQKGGAKVGGS